MPIVIGGKAEYPYQGDFKTIGAWWYMDRTVLNFSANVDVGIFGEKNIKVSFLLFDTRWESSPKGQIDLSQFIK